MKSIQWNNEVDVGRRMRELRAEKNLSIRALAELSGLNVNPLSLIENGKTSPSVSTLQQVAIALGVPITAFFDHMTPHRSVVHQKGSQRSEAPFSHGWLANLGSGFTQRGLEPFIVQIDAHASSGDTPIMHTGLEFVYCLEGQLLRFAANRYHVEDQDFSLEPGDSLLFEAHLPHRWSNPATLPAQAILVLQPAEADDRPTQEHFKLP